MGAYGTLSATNTDKSVNYRLALNITASEALGGVEWVRLTKTPNFIIIKPLVIVGDPKEVVNKTHVCYSRGRYAQMGIMRMVSDGSIRKDLLGKRYKIKKDKEGKLYVCLNEEIKKDGDG